MNESRANQDLAPQLVDTTVVQFFNREDETRWRWSNNGVYTASSFYRVMQSGGTIGWRYVYIWKTNTPRKVQVFAVLMLMNMILTHDTMCRRGMQCDLRCVMCDSCRVETEIHLFFRCRYAALVWRGIERCKGKTVMKIGDSIERTWDDSWEEARQDGTMERKDWATLFMCVVWNLWKQRNETN